MVKKINQCYPKKGSGCMSCTLEIVRLANDAIQQIIDKQYDTGLNGKVVYIGLAHHGKEASIQWKQKGC